MSKPSWRSRRNEKSEVVHAAHSLSHKQADGSVSLPEMEVRDISSSILRLQLLLNPPLPQCQTKAGLSKVPPLRLSSICPPSSPPPPPTLLYLFGPFSLLHPTHCWGSEFRCWGTVPGCVWSVKARQARREGEMVRRQNAVFGFWWNAADVLTDLLVPSLPLSKYMVTLLSSSRYIHLCG